MAVRRVLSKKGKTILIVSIIAGILIIGGSGYLLWRINQEEKLSSEETGAVSCVAGSQCPACEWPEVAYCGCKGETSPQWRTCGCRKPGNFSCGQACGTANSCTPDACPSGWESCGISGQDGAEATGCVAKTKCSGKCSNCQNAFVVKRYCKQVAEANKCDGGGWTKTLPTTVEHGQSVEISGYGKDSDGINPSSVVIKIDGTSVGNGSAKVDSTDSTKTNWSYKFTNLTVGSHKVEISWKDNKGLTGTNCTLSGTFTVSIQNVCDGGAWIKEIPSQVEKGQAVEISGYGKDSDGVDPASVIITLNGNAVSGVDSSVDGTDTTKTNWSYTLTGLEKGEHTVTITWKDTKGLGGSNCTLTDTFTVTETVITNPDWQITKTGIPVCSEGATDDLDTVQITYAITITNKGNGEGTLEKIVDTLDQKMQEGFLVQGSLSNSGVYSGGVITWSLSGDNAVFDPGESKTYQYNLSIPRTSFGTYGNTVVATPAEGDSFSTVASIQADCTVTEDIPQTGIFDDASRKILIGFGFLALGMLYMKFDFVKLAWNGVKDGKRKIFRSTEKNKIKRMFSLRKRFEKKIVKSK